MMITMMMMIMMSGCSVVVVVVEVVIVIYLFFRNLFQTCSGVCDEHWIRLSLWFNELFRPDSLQMRTWTLLFDEFF